MKNAQYGSSLTDSQWEYLKPMLPKPAKRGRPPTNLREVIDAIFYVVKGGIPWRYLPANFPPWPTVYGIFRRWKRGHLWTALNDALRILVRKAEGKRSQPTAAVVDSQSVKSAGHGGEVGYDAGKRIKGRKRHLVVDTLGLVLGVVVTPANVTERDGAKAVLRRVLAWFTWLRLLWVDGGYTGTAFANWVKARRSKLDVQVVKRSDDMRGFIVLPRRWVVERTFAWLFHHRRLVRDYETTITSAEALVYIAMIRIQLRRLA
jgi:transposase